MPHCCRSCKSCCSRNCCWCCCRSCKSCCRYCCGSPCFDDECQQLLNQGDPVTRQPSRINMGRKQKDIELQKLQAENEQLNQQVRSLKDRITEKDERHQKTLSVRELKIKQLNEEIEKLEIKNNDILTRLSALASAKLTDDNPNIADLSDINRPNKLAEQFSELYDNEWTNAFEVLNAAVEDKKTEKQTCKLLLDVLANIYSICHKKATGELQTLTEAVTAFSGVQTKEALKALKDERKKNYSSTVQKLTKEVKDSLKGNIAEQEVDFINDYIEKCTRICWLMSIQDPPVFIDAETDLQEQRFDTDKYKPYTQSGEIIDFSIWPVLYLYKDGTILKKGIAQGKTLKQTEIDKPENTHL